MTMRQRCFGAVLASLALAAGCSGPTPAQLLSQARQAMADGQPRTAQIHLKNLLRDQPDNAAARSLLGRATLALGDPVGAEVELRRALKLGADPAPLQLPLLRALMAQGKSAAALEQIHTGPELAAKDDKIAVLRIAGAAERSLGKLDQADAAYRKALKLAPGSPAVRTDLANLMLARRQVPEATRIVTAVLTDDSSFAPALLLRGRLEYLQRRYADAEDTCGKVLAVAKHGSPDYAQALSQLIETLLAEKKLDAASARADELLKIVPGSPAARVQKAEVEVAQGNLDGAEHRLEAVIARLPKYGPANRLLGIINVKQNQLDQGKMYLQAALTQNSHDNRARLALAHLYLTQGNVDGAKQLLAQSLPGVDDPGLMFALAGGASLRSGNSELAKEYFDQSEESRPKTLKDLLGLSSIYVAAGQFERAMRVIEDSDLTGKDADSVKSYLLALVQVRQGDFAKAEATARKLAAQQPNSGWPLNLEGTIAVLQKNYEQARDKYAAALDVEPKYVPAMLNLARVDLLLKDRKGAEAALRRAARADPKQPTAVLALAQFALQDKDLKAAASWLDRAPQDAAPTLRLKGELAAAQGRFRDAAGLFGRAYERQPQGAVAVEAYTAARRAGLPQPDRQIRDWIERSPRDPRVNLVLGSLAMERGNYGAAIQRYETVVDVEPKQPVALNNLAWLYSQRGDDRALAMAERAHEAAPKSPAIDDTLGWLRVQHGDAAGGLTLLETSRKAMPKSAEVQYHWAVALAETGKSAQAAGVLRDLLANGKEFPGRKDAQKRLEALQSGSGSTSE